MTPEEIRGDYTCTISVEDFRVNKKAEYKVTVHISFYSSRTQSIGSTSWHIWRGFTAFRKLDEQLRQRNTNDMKGIKFPPLHRRRSLFRTNMNAEFLERRSRDLNTYLSMITRHPQFIAFHITSIQSQTMKAFVGFTNGFGSNPHYEEQDQLLRPSISLLPHSSASAAVLRDTQSVIGDDDDDFRSESSMSTISTMSTSSMGDYRWSGTGFVGTANFPRPVTDGYTPSPSFSSRRSSHGSWFPTTESITENSISNGSRSVSLSRTSMMSLTPSDIITPEIDLQRAQMEEQLHKFDLMGVGMPPDGSCLLHCIVYEMYPLQCLKEYPTLMSVVNVGAADGMAPRRIAAAQMLRIRVAEYALSHLIPLAEFLMQNVEDLTERYELFRDTNDEQATIAELYAIASMFNIQIVLITNDESFQIDPVMPIVGLPSIRDGELRTITLGYLIPAQGVGGHYICTRERRIENTFVGGSYRGSIRIGPSRNGRCSSTSDRLSTQLRVS